MALNDNFFSPTHRGIHWNGISRRCCCYWRTHTSRSHSARCSETTVIELTRTLSLSPSLAIQVLWAHVGCEPSSVFHHTASCGYKLVNVASTARSVGWLLSYFGFYVTSRSPLFCLFNHQRTIYATHATKE